MNESDLIVVFGASFANYTGIARQADHPGRPRPHGAGPLRAVHVALQGHVAATADLLARALTVYEPAQDLRAEVAER